VPNFDMFAKTDVNGKNQNPIYTFLKSRCDSPQERFSDVKNLFYEPLLTNDIRWNFEKFLVDHKGNPVRRYDKTLDPMKIIRDIEHQLKKISWSK